jgi:hypothetical protein
MQVVVNDNDDDLHEFPAHEKSIFEYLDRDLLLVNKNFQEIIQRSD